MSVTVTPATAVPPPEQPAPRKRWGFIRNLVNPAARNSDQRIAERIRNIFMKGNDSDICDYVKRNPTTCHNQYVFGNLGGKHYPLLMVCRRNNRLSLETIKTVYEASPDDAIMGTLHHACTQRPVSVDTIQFLIEKHPDGAHSKTKGWLPLHAAIAGHATLDIIKYLIDCYPDSIKVRECDKLGLPFHLAIEHDASMEIIKYLYELYPDAIKVTNYETKSIDEVRGWLVHTGTLHHYGWGGGGLPIHLACREKLSIEILKFLIIKYPDGLRTKNRMGWLPLHYACSSNAEIDKIQMLVSCCPDSVIEPTMDYSYPVNICVAQLTPNLHTIQYLISKHPTLHFGPKEGLFWHYCEEAGSMFAPASVYHFLNSVAYQASRGYAFVYPNDQSKWD